VTASAMTYLDETTAAYVSDVIDAIEASGGEPIVGAYVLGSALLGGFDPARSDVDVVAVVAAPLDASARAAVVQALDRLPPPVRKLELVVYAAGAKPPAYELNYPDGESESSHWFVLDAAIGQERSEPLRGRPWSEVLQAVSEEEIRGAAQESLEWSARQPAGNEFARLNAARTRHYLEHGRWMTKEEARR
jgi:predicted nucleotidyltransferase